MNSKHLQRFLLLSMISCALLSVPLSEGIGETPAPSGENLAGIEVTMKAISSTDIVIGQDVDFEVTLRNLNDTPGRCWLWFTVKLEEQIHEKMVYAPYLSKASPFRALIPPYGVVVVQLSARPLDEIQAGFYTMTAKIGPYVVPFDRIWVSTMDSFSGTITLSETDRQRPGFQGESWIITSLRVVKEDVPPIMPGFAQPLPKAVTIIQNHPNPFNPSTTITYEVQPENNIRVPVKLVIYNVHGRLVRTLISEQKSAGTYTVHWNGRDERGMPANSGVYLFKLQSGNDISLKKGVLTK